MVSCQGEVDGERMIEFIDVELCVGRGACWMRGKERGRKVEFEGRDGRLSESHVTGGDTTDTLAAGSTCRK